MKTLLLSALFAITLAGSVAAQTAAFTSGGAYASFIEYQKTFPRADESFRKKY